MRIDFSLFWWYSIPNYNLRIDVFCIYNTKLCHWKFTRLSFYMYLSFLSVDNALYWFFYFSVFFALYFSFILRITWLRPQSLSMSSLLLLFAACKTRFVNSRCSCWSRRLDPSLTCNGNCSCDPISFTPVCGSDGQNYFSPCYAGCEAITDNITRTVGRCFVYTRKPSYRWQTRATRKHAKNCSNSTCLQRCRRQYWPIFIRSAVVASEICEIPRNSLKIPTSGVQGHPR